MALEEVRDFHPLRKMTQPSQVEVELAMMHLQQDQQQENRILD
jgi:hypothetical protein